MKTFFLHTIFSDEPGEKKMPVPVPETMIYMSAFRMCSFGAILLMYVAINSSGQQTEASVFLGVSSRVDTVMHIVWDKVPDGGSYLVERSNDGRWFTPVAKILQDAAPDIMQMEESSFSSFGSILYSTEGGHRRFIYNDIQKAEAGLQYRIKIYKANGDIVYSPTVNYARVNDNADTLGLHDFLQNLSVQGRSLCPPLGVPPSAPCILPTNIYNTQNLNCCVVTLRRYNHYNCGANNSCTDCICACSCTRDPCCVHSCIQYNNCSCHPWTSCGSSPTPQWIVVNTAPGLPLNVSAANVQICAGQSATLSATGASTYTWSPSTTLNSSTGSSVTATPSSTTTYTVTGDVNGCTATTQVTVTVNPLPVILVSPDDTICAGQYISLTATGAAAYTWSPSFSLNSSSGSFVTALPASTTTYTVTGNLNGCTATAQVTVTVNPLPVVSLSPDVTICNGQSTMLTAAGASAYVWNPFSTLSSSTGASVTATPSSTTTYTVTGDLNGCTATAQVTVTVNPLPVVSASPDVTICSGQSILLTATGANTYTWNPFSTLSSATGASVTATPSSTTTYTVTGDLNGCTAMAQVTVTVNPLPVVSASPDVTICNGQSTLLTATGANTYAWSPFSTLSSSTGVSVTAAPSSTTTYTVTGDLSGCTATSQVTVWVNPLPAVIFTPDPGAGCAPLTVQFTEASVTGNGSLYSWNFGDNSTSNLKNPDHTFLQPGTFTVSLMIISPAGCVNSSSGIVTVYPKPVAEYTAAPTIAERGTEIYFTDHSYSNITSWGWDFGDGKGISTVINPTYVYDSVGRFTVQLIVSNIYDCIDTTSSPIIITEGKFEIWIPNVFTPNGDNKNEIFKATGMYISKIDMTIFDRWGMEIFHTADKEQGWNGKMFGGGGDCLMDTYVYLIKAWDENNLARQFIGRITLLR